jgi:uncharacterized RDD family membrane protein YckC
LDAGWAWGYVAGIATGPVFFSILMQGRFMEERRESEDASTGEAEREHVRDEVTGQMVPADETVELHGYRVGAEGKQILLDRLQAGEPLAGGPEQPGGWRRVGCYLLDALILVVFYVVVRWILLAPFLPAPAQQQSAIGGPGPGQRPPWPWEMMTNTQAILAALGGTLFSVVVIAYYAVLHARTGQTLGKKAGSIRVVNMDFTPISTETAWKRAFFFLGPPILGSLALLFFPLAPAGAYMTSSFLEVAAGIYVLVSGIVGLADSDQQRALHDRFTGTRVI